MMLCCVGLTRVAGVHFVFDTSFSRFFSLEERYVCGVHVPWTVCIVLMLDSAREFIARFKEARAGPLISSICPGMLVLRLCVCRSMGLKICVLLTRVGWVCYAEKSHGDVMLPFMSAAKSPQQVMGSLVKVHFAAKHHHVYVRTCVRHRSSSSSSAKSVLLLYLLCCSVVHLIYVRRPKKMFHVAVMPCFDKKLEASRPDFFSVRVLPLMSARDGHRWRTTRAMWTV